MITKSKVLTTLKSLLIMLFINDAYAQSSDSEKILALKAFYTSYITENSKMPVNEVKVNALKHKYCSAQFLNNLDKQEWDHDPFLNAQDCLPNWLNSLVVKKQSHSSNIFNVSYFDHYSQKKITIKLTVVKVGDSVKINGIVP